MKILLLAGTAEARALAALMHRAGVPAIASLAGVTRTAAELALPVRVGGFGGDDGFRAYLAREGITHVIDGTHPFAERISLRSARICGENSVRYLQVLRPEWQPDPADNWHLIDREEEVVSLAPPGATVFLATGRQTLERFRNLEGRRIILRQIDPPTGPFPFEGGEFLIGRPPFSVDAEIATFSQLGVDWLVVKNAGGAASHTKIEAARALKLPVAMIARPPQPLAERVETPEQAMAWLKG